MKKIYFILIMAGALFLANCAGKDPYAGLQKSPCACLDNNTNKTQG